MEIKKENFKGVHTIAIYGDIGTGKTALAYTLLDLLKEDKKVYFLKHPKPNIIKDLGYFNLDSLERIEDLKDCVLYIDEPQLHLNIYEKQSNLIIAKLCSLARQLDIILILSSSDTRIFTKHNESYFDLWILKDIDFNMVKQRSKIRQIIKNNTIFHPSGFNLNKNEFIIDCRKLSNLNGKYSFNVPNYFNNSYSKPYKN